MRNYRLAPSILSADFKELGRDIKDAADAGADWLHIDVMDGLFVPSISFGMPVIKSIRSLSDIFFDVHLMIEKPERYLEEFAKCGADGITFHYEATEDAKKCIDIIHSLGKKAGISINPETSASVLSDEILSEVDLILIMTVHPGFGGQKYIHDCTEKIGAIRKRLDEKGLKASLEVDGGVNKDTIGIVLTAGADTIVIGSSVFIGDTAKNTRYYKKVIDEFSNGGK